VAFKQLDRLWVNARFRKRAAGCEQMSGLCGSRQTTLAIARHPSTAEHRNRLATPLKHIVKTSKCDQPAALTWEEPSGIRAVDPHLLGRECTEPRKTYELEWVQAHINPTSDH